MIKYERKFSKHKAFEWRDSEYYTQADEVLQRRTQGLFNLAFYSEFNL